MWQQGLVLASILLTFESFITRCFKLIRFVVFFLTELGGGAGCRTWVEVNRLDLLFYLLLFIFTHRLSVRDQGFVVAISLLSISKEENTSLAPTSRVKIWLTCWAADDDALSLSEVAAAVLDSSSAGVLLSSGISSSVFVAAAESLFYYASMLLVLQYFILKNFPDF